MGDIVKGMFVFFFIFHFNCNYRICALRAPVALVQRHDKIYTLRVRTLAFGLKMEIKCLLFLFRPTVILVAIFQSFSYQTDELMSTSTQIETGV